ncbi:MAG: ROK family protein [Planctomycetota bacterium]
MNRPSTQHRSSRTGVLGVDIGGTKMAVSLWSDDRRIDKTRWETLPGVEANLARIVREGRRLVEEHGGPLARVGVSAGGLVDLESGTILSVPNLEGWEQVPIRSELEAAFQVGVSVENDANASAIAEWRFGAGRGATNFAFLTCSTGIGAGLISSGKLLRGANDLAGEIGHVPIVAEGAVCGCGLRGCLEAYASGSGMARRLAEHAERSGDAGTPRTAKEAVERAKSGCEFSISFLEETAGYLARGLTPLIFTLNPDCIVLGTVVVGAGDLILSLMMNCTASLRSKCTNAQ